MIQANELRIGNLVYYDDRVFEIDTIAKEFPTLNTTEFGIGAVGWNSIYPIIITEEWLLKFGFTQSSAFKSVYFIGTFLNITLGNKIMFEINDQIISEIKYIHQLQNIYFAHAQTELTLKDA